jgi:hypothetical protein
MTCFWTPILKISTWLLASDLPKTRLDNFTTKGSTFANVGPIQAGSSGSECSERRFTGPARLPAPYLCTNALETPSKQPKMTAFDPFFDPFLAKVAIYPLWSWKRPLGKGSFLDPFWPLFDQSGYLSFMELKKTSRKRAILGVFGPLFDPFLALLRNHAQNALLSSLELMVLKWASKRTLQNALFWGFWPVYRLFI